jgi:O-antigen/teichoic acid export membrane protein
MRLGLNIFANYVGKLWSILSVYIFVPFYINLLGIETYGVINFYTVLTSLLLFLDLGLSSAIVRELAQKDSIEFKRNLIFTTEIIFLSISLFLFLALYFFSGIIASSWLNSGFYSQELMAKCVVLMGASIALNLYSMMHINALMGLQEQVIANAVQVISSVFKFGVVILVLSFYKSVEYFFYWQLFSSILFFFIGRTLLWSRLKSESKVFFDSNIINSLKSFSIAMMIMSLVGALNTQLDKLFVGKYLSLTQFSYYSLSSTLSQVPVLLITPLIMAVYPSLVKLSFDAKVEALKERFGHFSFITIFISSLIGAYIFFFSFEISLFWTKNIDIANEVSGISKYLVVGSVFLAAQYLPYQLAIANGHTKTSLYLGIGSIIFLIISLWYFIQHFGQIGAAFPWLIINVFSFFYLSRVVIRMHFRDYFLKWLSNNFLIPCVLNGVLSYLLFTASSEFLPLKNIFISFFVLVSFSFPLHLLVFNKIYTSFSFKKVLSN